MPKPGCKEREGNRAIADARVLASDVKAGQNDATPVRGEPFEAWAVPRRRERAWSGSSPLMETDPPFAARSAKTGRSPLPVSGQAQVSVRNGPKNQPLPGL